MAIRLVNLAVDINNMQLASGSTTNWNQNVNTGAKDGINLHGLTNEGGAKQNFGTGVNAAPILDQAIYGGNAKALGKLDPNSAEYKKLEAGNVDDPLQKKCLQGDQMYCGMYDRRMAKNTLLVLLI